MFGYLLDRDMLQAQSAHMFVLLCVTNEVLLESQSLFYISWGDCGVLRKLN